MIRAEELLKLRNEKEEERNKLKAKTERINSELLEVERAINQYYKDINKGNEVKKYIEVEINISEDVELIVRDQGYYPMYNIEKPNITRLFLEKPISKVNIKDLNKIEYDLENVATILRNAMESKIGSGAI